MQILVPFRSRKGGLLESTMDKHPHLPVVDDTFVDSFTLDWRTKVPNRSSCGAFLEFDHRTVHLWDSAGNVNNIGSLLFMLIVAGTHHLKCHVAQAGLEASEKLLFDSPPGEDIAEPEDLLASLATSSSTAAIAMNVGCHVFV